MNKFQAKSKNVLMTTITSYILMALYAILLNMIGELLPEIMSDYNLTMSQGGLLQTVFNIGGIVALLCMLYFSDRIRKSKLIYYGFLITSVSLAFIGLFTNSYLLLLFSFVILGSSTKVFDVSVNAYVNDINTKGREFFLQMLHTSFGIGAVLGPAYASFMIISNFGWKTAFWFLGAIYLFVLFISIYTMLKPSSEIEKNLVHHKHKALGIMSLIKNPQVWILFIGAGCFSGAYVGMVTWFPTYAKSLPGKAGALSGLILSIFFFGYVISRGIASFILTTKNARFLIILTSLMGGVTFIIAFLISQTWAFFTFMPLAGFFAGATLPMIIFVACTIFPNNSGG
ncbi:MAG: MFS transporter, partial [Clostridiales bacterium]|nr:MFS transporter [Clostridiales bacterium]